MNNMDSDKTNGNSAGCIKKNHRHLTGAKLARIIGWVFAGVAIACFFALVFGLLVQWLWGVTLSPIFDLPQITYWQAVGLIVLAKLIFGAVGHPHKYSNHSLRHKKWHDRFEGSYSNSSSFADHIKSHAEHGKYYRDFWEQEGKNAFEDYLNRRRSASD